MPHGNHFQGGNYYPLMQKFISDHAQNRSGFVEMEVETTIFRTHLRKNCFIGIIIEYNCMHKNKANLQLK